MLSWVADHADSVRAFTPPPLRITLFPQPSLTVRLSTDGCRPALEDRLWSPWEPRCECSAALAALPGSIHWDLAESLPWKALLCQPSTGCWVQKSSQSPAVTRPDQGASQLVLGTQKPLVSGVLDTERERS